MTRLQDIIDGKYCLACKNPCTQCNGGRCKCGMRQIQVKLNNEKLQKEMDEHFSNPELQIKLSPDRVTADYQKSLDIERWGWPKIS